MKKIISFPSFLLQSKYFQSKRKLSTLFIIPLLYAGTVISQIPTGYYDNALNKTGNDLKNSLHNIIKNHDTYPYSSSNTTDVWDVLKVADRDPNDPTKVIGVYSNFSMDAAAEYANGNGWNREHVWAKSRGDFGTDRGVGTDLHNLRASDISTNSARNNKNFDYADFYYDDTSGNYSGLTDSKTSDTDWVWEPRDEVKGDIARTIFYMATRYEGGGIEPDLELTETLMDNSDRSPFHSKLSVLLEWHQNDPVSPEEELRNEVIFSYQNNRNPFIDHPEYVCEIYSCTTTPPNPPNPTTSELFISEYIEGSSYNKAIEIANYTGASVDLSNYSIRKQSNGSGNWSNLSLSGTLANGDVYIIANTAASSAITNVADLTTSSSSLNFNGNDPVALFNGSTLVDVIGTPNGGSGYFAKDRTLVRKSSIDTPNTTYTINEWNIEVKNNFNFIGYHEGSTPVAFDLFISEYIEGSSYNKAIEIANHTGASVDLSDYSIRKQSNGSGSWSNLSLSGTLANGDVYVVANASSSSSIANNADLTTYSSSITFNGNDPVALFKGSTLIDIVGTQNGGSGYFAKDVTMVRKSSVDQPNTTYTTDEWLFKSKDEFGFIGYHTFGATARKTTFSQEIPNKITPEKSLSIYPNPAISELRYTINENVLRVNIFDIHGRSQNVTVDTNRNALDVSHLSPGVYIITAQTETGIQALQFVKQ